LDLAGGWLDQPWVSELCSGYVVDISLEPTIEFKTRSGMATSTRESAIELWGDGLPEGQDPWKLAKMLFCWDNPPGTQEVSGAQDAIGICVPGLSISRYAGEYWPVDTEHLMDPDIIRFLESSLHLIHLGKRSPYYNPLVSTRLGVRTVRRYADAVSLLIEAILSMDPNNFGRAMKAQFEAQTTLFPEMVTPKVQQAIDGLYERRGVSGWKLAGAGGGGYLVFVAPEPQPGTLKVKIRAG
jgi:hypothetical protein